tara:strand:+ start:3288 stop:3830 length:543 start_codon:yes stop_codon:yes gene_type:complete
MTVAQELTRMTPEVNHALLSAPGVIMPGEQGPKEIIDKRKTRKGWNKVTGATTNRFTANQRGLISYLRQNGKSEARAISKSVNFNVVEASRGLVKAGFVQKAEGRYLTFELTAKGETVELRKTLREDCIDAMQSLGEFGLAELKKSVSKATACRTITQMMDEAKIETIPGAVPTRYRWVK